MRAAGLAVAAIGIGEPKHAQRYGDLLAPSVTCLANKSLEAYHAYGIRQGSALQLIGPKVLAAGAQAAARGSRQDQATGNTFMLGANFVIDGQGVIRFAAYDEFAGDHPEFQTILAAVTQLGLKAAR